MGAERVNEIKVLDVVAVLEDVQQHALLRSEIGTVVELWKVACSKLSLATPQESLRLRTITRRSVAQLNLPKTFGMRV